MIKVLVVGGTGMLGHKLVQVLGAERQLELHTTVRRLPQPTYITPGVTYHEGVEIEFGSGALRAVLEKTRPDVVVNAVGAIKQKNLYAAIDETFYINATLPHLLALLNPNPSARVIHFSTDCVFQGDRGGYTEADVPDAVDLYGRSKAAGEMAYGQHLTIRTSIIGFEIGGSNLGLLSWLFSQPPASTLPGFTQAIFSGLPTVTLSRTVRDYILDGCAFSGVYHVASDPISKYELLDRLNAGFGLGHRIVRHDAVHIDRSLDDTSFRRLTGTQRPGWSDLVEQIVADFQTLPYATQIAALGANR